ncbi:MAG: 16S rRNA (cytosine(1402)-N(4))-methyltransferase RsmH [SAR202 cluster bacterium]|nr:16S rRNA (cytosine(1402)-N(4))-methyltransferase RsmH [SAR202 cluster bacterium]|tara:strand:+ start:30542 stop:31471 length:930 start_codon:yes stop_codon:yes gene_type:complete
MKIEHVPVMKKEIGSALSVIKNGIYLDCTIGEGGHALSLLESDNSPKKILGIDLDKFILKTTRERLKNYKNKVCLSHGNFANLKTIIAKMGYEKVTGILFDLGLSSFQIEKPNRGFSFGKTEKLDMRFNTNQIIDAGKIVNSYPESRLKEVIFKFGEEPKAKKIANAIVQNRPIEDTYTLSEIIKKAIGKQQNSRKGINPATKSFQAIRIEVNQEFSNIQSGLNQAIEVLDKSGIIAVISYHSLEDRIVKNILRNASKNCICPDQIPKCICQHKATVKLVSNKVIKPSEKEIKENPRSRSAKLRLAKKL